MKTVLGNSHGIVLIALVLCVSLIAGCLQSKNTGNKTIKKVESVAVEIDPARWFESVRWGSMIEVRELLAQGADPDLIFDNGESALHLAVEQRNYELAELLQVYGGDVNIQERKEGYTPLMYAAIMDDRKMMQLLIGHGADPTVADVDGYTAYHYLAYRGNSAAIRLIAGKAPAPTELPTKDGLTVADVASLSRVTTRMTMASATN